MTKPLIKLVAVSVVRDRQRKPAAQRVCNHDDAAKLLRAVLPTDREGFAVMHLNARHEVTSIELVSIGSLNVSIVHPREVLKGALLANAAAIIMGHNHPSGAVDASDDDISITSRLLKACDLMGITLLDHIIITSTQSTSMRDGGLIR